MLPCHSDFTPLASDRGGAANISANREDVTIQGERPYPVGRGEEQYTENVLSSSVAVDRIEDEIVC